MARSIDNRVMIRICEELSSAALDRHTTSPLIFAFVHEYHYSSQPPTPRD